MENQNNEVVKQPKKRISPIVVPTLEDVVEEPQKASKTKKSSSKKDDSNKEANAISSKKNGTTKKTSPKVDEEVKETKKTASKKSTVKKTDSTTTKKTTAAKSTTQTKKTAKPKIDVTKITSVKIDPRTGTIKQKSDKKPKEEIKIETIIEEPKKAISKPKPKKTSIKSKDVTIEPAPRDLTPKEIVRPTPKKTKQFNKEEKVLYKKLEEAFNTVANMATVIEERTMDTKNIPDLTIGEMHVIEMVNRYNNKPMTLIAKKMHVTVGSLTIGVNRLVQKGYLLRIRDEMDRRVILLSVTQQGKKALKYHDKFHDDVLGIVLDTIPLQQAVKVMSQFAYVLELYYDPTIEPMEEKRTSRKEKK